MLEQWLQRTEDEALIGELAKLMRAGRITLGAYRILERLRVWNGKHPELPMKMSAAEEFFGHLIGKYGDNFSTASGDATGHWCSGSVGNGEGVPPLT